MVYDIKSPGWVLGIKFLAADFAVLKSYETRDLGRSDIDNNDGGYIFYFGGTDL